MHYNEEMWDILCFITTTQSVCMTYYTMSFYVFDLGHKKYTFTYYMYTI